MGRARQRTAHDAPECKEPDFSDFGTGPVNIQPPGVEVAASDDNP